MFSTALSYTLEAAYREAANRKHAFFCVEHLLYALLFDEEIAEIIKNCGGSAPAIKRDLEGFFEKHVEKVDFNGAAQEDEPREMGPIQTPAIQRVLQRAILQMNSAGKDVVTGKDVLAQIFFEKETHAAYFLAKQDIQRMDVINFISHGMSKIAVAEGEGEGPTGREAEEDEGGDASVERESRRKSRALDQFCEDLTERARAGVLDRFIGREWVVERML